MSNADFKVWYGNRFIKKNVFLSADGDVYRLTASGLKKINCFISYFTGYLDCRGEKIYSGDILSRGQDRAVVLWENGGWRIKKELKLFPLIKMVKSYKITGSIYQDRFECENFNI